MRESLRSLLDTPVSLKELELLLLDLPLVEQFRSAIGSRRRRQALLVRWVDLQDDWGIGECSCRPDPYFNGEFLEGAVALLQDFVFPQLPKSGSFSGLLQVAGRVRGWNFTVASLLDALTDLLRRQGLPDLLDQWVEPPLQRVPAGISLPLFATSEEAVGRVAKAVLEGYRRVKLKVSPSMNLETLRSIREVFSDVPLGFDANGSCRREDLQFLRELAALNPESLEQPFAPDRLDLCVELKKLVPDLRICLDESIDGLGDLFAAHRLGALDELNLKPGRVGGPLNTIQLVDYCRRENLPVWVGGMFESGVGRSANLRVAARLPGATAHDIGPSRRYFEVDVVKHPVEMDEEGYVHFDQGPVQLDEVVLNRFCVNRIRLTR